VEIGARLLPEYSDAIDAERKPDSAIAAIGSFIITFQQKTVRNPAPRRAHPSLTVNSFLCMKIGSAFRVCLALQAVIVKRLFVDAGGGGGDGGGAFGGEFGEE